VSADDTVARRLAEQWQLEYREPHTVSIDPRALSLLEGADCRRLRAVPLTAGADGALVAVARPDEERFAAVRALTGEQTRFVVIGERTLDALLGSRIFGERPPESLSPWAGAKAAAIPAVVPTPVLEQASGPPTIVPFTEPPKLDQAAVVGAVVAALERRAPQSAAPVTEHGTAAPAVPVEELVSQMDAAAQAWSSLRAVFDGTAPELEAARRSLREAKEQLSVSHAEIDQHQRRIRALETELAESRSLLSEARLRLQETAEALDLGASRLEESRELF
jgi:hypothetical protein